eukprot:CAMPEP_0204020362 /NCGR_PEP_ID=MMETSP0360-20130528/29373_1 /ASSEMBLY_ACC=CAM_ASM_000342 /TAXON_ID=268821 /ORGANISM="Scrippsiella Hangoei, Strain SHTV-5" /LENGTH=84 /DNA_ID=CAMNT_0050963661 /DNA_START=70 /DNA_END=321 /DNA_ORIENTATION=+
MNRAAPELTAVEVRDRGGGPVGVRVVHLDLAAPGQADEAHHSGLRHVLPDRILVGAIGDAANEHLVVCQPDGAALAAAAAQLTA